MAATTKIQLTEKAPDDLADGYELPKGKRSKGSVVELSPFAAQAFIVRGVARFVGNDEPLIDL